jgi:hypothetical protein
LCTSEGVINVAIEGAKLPFAVRQREFSASQKLPIEKANFA